MGFQTTHWTVVLAAREKDSTSAREALAGLCASYWHALDAFIRRQGSSPHEAEDLTQEFLIRFVERHALESMQPAAGKFRSFLLACLKNFLTNERERAQAQRRGGGLPHVTFDGRDAETRYALESADHRTPEVVFERCWAFAVLEQTLAELRREQTGKEQSARFEELQGFLPAGRATVSRAGLAATGWTNLQLVVTATNTRTVLQFGFLDDTSNLGFDDVSLVRIVEPALTGFNFSGTNPVLNGTNGLYGVAYQILMSTILAQPLHQWTPITTNVLGADENFTITATNTVSPTVPQRFYILSAQ